MNAQQRLGSPNHHTPKQENIQKRRHFIVTCLMHIDAKQVHKAMSLTLPKDLFRIKRIRKRDRSYIRVSIDPLAGIAHTAKALRNLRLTLGARTREVSIKKKPIRLQKSKAKEEISVLTVNINGLKNSLAELRVLIAKMHPDVVCIQETRRIGGSNPTTIAGYTTIESPYGEKGTGLLTAISNRAGLIVKRVSVRENWLSTVVLGKKGQIDVINTYRHNGSEQRGITMAEIANHMKENRVRNIPSVAIGDWNGLAHDCAKTLQYHGITAIAENAGKKGTRVNSRGRPTKRAIDFAITDTINTISKQRRLTNWRISDHYPVLATLRIERATITEETTILFDRKRLEDPIIAKKIRECPAPEDESLSLQEYTTRFYENLMEHLRKLRILRETKGSNNDYISAKVKLAVHHKRILSRLVRKRRTEFDGLIEATKNLSKILREEKMKERRKALKQGILAMNQGNLKECWKWIKKRAGISTAPTASQRIYKAGSKEISSSDQENIAQWRLHFKSLSTICSDEKRLEGIKKPCPRLTEISDSPILWSEVRVTMAKLRKSKAAGDDRIPIELFKLCENEETPQSSLARSTFYILKRSFEEGVIPKEWQTCAIVPILKKGDAKDPNNYRGIALINTMLKIMTKILACRIKEACDEGKILI